MNTFLPAGAERVHTALVALADDKGRIEQASWDVLAARSRVSVRTVSRAIRLLERRGLIRVDHQRFKGRPNNYQVL